MNTETKTKKQINQEEMSEFAQLLKDNGFKVIVSAKGWPGSWMFFEKDGQIGHVDADYFGGYNFGTVHKPCRECGTGYGTVRETNLTIKNAEDTLIFAPSWATASDCKAIRKYKDVQDFITSTHNKWAEYYIL